MRGGYISQRGSHKLTYDKSFAAPACRRVFECHTEFSWQPRHEIRDVPQAAGAVYCLTNREVAVLAPRAMPPHQAELHIAFQVAAAVDPGLSPRRPRLFHKPQILVFDLHARIDSRSRRIEISRQYLMRLLMTMCRELRLEISLKTKLT